MSRPMPAPHIRLVSEKKREHEVLQYVDAYRDLPHVELAGGPHAYHLPPDYHARPSTDSTLTALCQLAALRMNAQRALISLLDAECQHVLAEATPQSSLRGRAPPEGGTNLLWLGSVSIRRSWGLCGEQVLGLDLARLATNGGTPVVVINDLFNIDQYAQRTYVRNGPHNRFYAGAALVSPHGAIVGALCVFDDTARPEGISNDDQSFLSDLAVTAVEHLNNYIVKNKFKRGEKLTRGLISFAEGASALLPLYDNEQPLDSRPRSPTTTASTLGSDVELGVQDDSSTEKQTLPAAETNEDASRPSQAGTQGAMPMSHEGKPQHFSTGSNTVRVGSTQVTSLRALQDTILPVNSRSMFTRAANIMLASSDLDGVLILDASVAATGHRQNPAAPERERYADGLSDSAGHYSKSDSSDDSSSQSSNANQGQDRASSKRCQILGAAPPQPTVNANGTPNIDSLLENTLARLLRDHPHGRLFNYTANGLSVSSTDDSSSNNDRLKNASSKAEPRRMGHRSREQASRSSKAISALLPSARSVAFVPFWDYERSRWFAGCLCWTNTPDRLLSVSVDLAYFTIFSHSIMRELSRLDAIALNQQKTTFVASISHELRSPLHGILGTLEFIRDTPLDSFQSSMLNSLNSCGQTLLDTINHVMDHSKLSDSKKVSTRRLKDANTIQLSSKPLKTQRSPRDPAFDLSIATEEVVEAVFAGSSFLPIMSSKNAPLSPTTSSTTTSTAANTSEITTKRKTCYIILDVAHEQDWIYCFPIGSWKRTVMNLFGNSIKYTERGHVTVSLHAADVTKSTGTTTTITLTITDTGTGMSPNFLANKAFQPFSQENPYASGVGLGLSIVRQVIETNGGKIQVSSDHSSGTKISVKLSLLRSEVAQVALPQRLEYLNWLPRLEGRKVCILHRVENEKTEAWEEPQDGEGLIKFINALATTLTNHLKMEVVQTTNWEDNDTDLVICPEPSFAYLKAIRDERVEVKATKAAITIFVALDALEAATLRSDVRVQNKESVVEIMTQPLGPYKLAYVLNKCLNRFEDPKENSQRTYEPTGVSTTDPSPRRSPSPEDPTSDSQPPTLSPPTAEMPPLLNQSHWLQTDRSDDSTTPTAQTLEASTLASEMTDTGDRVLSSRPRLTIQAGPVSNLSNVLITDDNAINRRLLVAFMKKNSLQYTEAEDGLEAFRAYQSAQTRFDIVLMDMSMPVMDGVSATRAIRNYELEYNIPRCFIIALTGLASASARLEAWNAGIDHFMTKPVNFKALEKFLRKVESKRDEATGTSGGLV